MTTCIVYAGVAPKYGEKCDEVVPAARSDTTRFVSSPMFALACRG